MQVLGQQDQVTAYVAFVNVLVLVGLGNIYFTTKDGFEFVLFFLAAVDLGTIVV